MKLLHNFNHNLKLAIASLAIFLTACVIPSNIQLKSGDSATNASATIPLNLDDITNINIGVNLYTNLIKQNADYINSSALLMQGNLTIGNSWLLKSNSSVQISRTGNTLHWTVNGFKQNSKNLNLIVTGSSNNIRDINNSYNPFDASSKKAQQELNNASSFTANPFFSKTDKSQTIIVNTNSAIIDISKQLFGFSFPLDKIYTLTMAIPVSGASVNQDDNGRLINQSFSYRNDTIIVKYYNYRNHGLITIPQRVEISSKFWRKSVIFSNLIWSKIF